jgi:transcription antitermination factor NusG
MVARGYEVFLPSYHDHRRWSDRVKRVERALFPGYVFCREYEQSLPKLVTSPGVIRIVGDQRQPVAVPENEIRAIQRIVNTRLKAEPYQFLKRGDHVVVDHGPLRGTEGIVVVIKNRHRLVVSIALLQRAVSVEIDASWVVVPPATALAMA